MADAKRYAASQSPTRYRQIAVIVPDLPAVTADTPLVSTQTASQLLKENRGLDLSQVAIQRRCATGQWRKGYHWVRSGKQYLIHMAAVYESIVAGDA